MEYRHPHLILGVDYGATAEEATLAFGKKAKRVRRDPDAPFTLEDLTWALNQLEHGDEEPEGTFVHLRVPADPDAYDEFDATASRVPGLPRLAPHDPTIAASLQAIVHRREHLAAASNTPLAPSPPTEAQPPHLPPFPELPQHQSSEPSSAQGSQTASTGTSGTRRRLIVAGAILLLIVVAAAWLPELAEFVAGREARTPSTTSAGEATPQASPEDSEQPNQADTDETPADAASSSATERDSEGRLDEDCTSDECRARNDAQVPEALPRALRQLRIGLPQPAIVLAADEQGARVVVYRQGITSSDVRTQLRAWADTEGWELVHEATNVHPRLDACDVYVPVTENDDTSSADYLSARFITPPGSEQVYVAEEFGVTGPFIDMTVGDWPEDCGPEPPTSSNLPGEPPLWVAQLASVPVDAGQEELDSVYQDVLEQVPSAFVISSNDFASLNPGYFVVVATDNFRDGYAALDFCADHGRTENTACVGRYLSDSEADSDRQCMFDDRRMEVCT